MSKSISTQQAELLANSFLNYAGALVVVMDKDGRIVQFNRASENLSGLSYDDVIGKYPWDTFLPPEDAETIRKNAFEVLANNPKAMSGSYTNYWVIKDGGRALIEWSNTVILDDQQRFSHLISVGTDITERNTNQQKLESSEARLKEAQRIAKVGSWELDLLNNTLVWSDEIFNIFDIDQTKFEASYDAFLNAIHPDDRELVNKAYNDSLINRTPYEITHRLMMNDGSIIYVRETCESFFDSDNKPVRSVGTVQDITDLHIAEKELRLHRDHLEEIVQERTANMEAARNEAEKANKSKSEFLSQMSHELRTPLNAILGFGQLLELDAKKFSDTQNENVKEILNAGYHLLDLINDVLDLAKIEAGKMDINIEDVTLTNLINQCVILVDLQAKERNITLIEKLTTENRMVRADATRLKQVLLNLLSNAVKYNRQDGHITLSTEVVNDQRIRISVADTGEGFSEADIDKLYSPFERLNTKHNTDGTGIGLTISKYLTELMNGTMGFESAAGEGSTFWIELELSNN